MIKINDFYENKDKIVGVFLVSINLIFFYFCCIVPYNKLNQKNNKIENYEVKLKRIAFEKSQIEKIYKSKKEKDEEIKKKYDEYRKIILKKSFKNINSFEKIIYKKIKKHGLFSQIIGRVEKVGEEEVGGKVYISYEIDGKYIKIKDFINELENEEYLISVTDTPFYLETKDGDSKIKLKIAGYILNLFKKNEEEKQSFMEEEKIFISFDELNILEKKILNLNKNRYLLLKYKKGGRDILCENEEFEKEGKKYKIKISEEGIYLDDGEIK